MLLALAALRCAAPPTFSRCMAEGNAAISATGGKSETTNSRSVQQTSLSVSYYQCLLSQKVSRQVNIEGLVNLVELSNDRPTIVLYRPTIVL